jgi:hypothetical protein
MELNRKIKLLLRSLEFKISKRDGTDGTKM